MKQDIFEIFNPEQFHIKTLCDNPEIFAAVISPISNGISPQEIKPEDIKKVYKKCAILPDQTHSVNVDTVEDGKSDYPDTDALISHKPGKPIGIITADCVPILLYAPDINAVAAVHAGWKGTINGIVDNAVSELKKEGADCAVMRAFFGPSICSECYEVSRELGKEFEDAGYKECVYWPNSEEGRPHIDLQRVNVNKLTENGLKIENITTSEECTLTSTDSSGLHLYPSYRRDGVKASRLMTLIMLR